MEGFVLCHLATHAGQLVTKEELRKALRDDSRTPRFIKTVPGRGYRSLQK